MEDGDSSHKAIIIGVCAGVGSLLLIFVVYRVWRCTRTPKIPLPPKQPLVFKEEPQITPHYPEPSFLHVPVASSSRILYQNLPQAEIGSTTDLSSFSPSSPSVVSSQAPLFPSHSESEESIERSRGLDSSASTIRHQRQHRARTVSNAGSIRSMRSYHSGHGTIRSQHSAHGTIRSPPHRRPINVVLPQPLAPGLSNSGISSANVSTTSFQSSIRDNVPGPSSAYVPPPTIRQSPHRHRRAATAVSSPAVPPVPTGVSPRSMSVDEGRRRSKSRERPPANYSPDYGPPPLPPPKDPEMMPPRRMPLRQ